MTLLIVHTVLLAWFSHATARRLLPDRIDQLIASAMLFWGNIVTNCLLLSLVGKLGESDWFFRVSLILGALTLWAVARFVSRPTSATPPQTDSADRPNGWLLAGVLGTLALVLLANLRIAYVHPPNNYDSLAYHLPRVMYYLGHNTLAQFESADIRQVYFTFNYNLLQLFCFIYSPPHEAINFLNVASWVVAGFGVYRVSRLCGGSANASLIATWLALTATGVVAQATATTLDLPTAAALFVAIAFGLRWRQDRRTRDALLAGLAAGLAGGAKLTVVFFGPTVVLLIAVFLFQHWRRGATRHFATDVRAWVGPGLLAIALAIPFIIYNLAATGQWMTKELDFTLNKPFSLAGAWQTSKAYLFQLFFEPFGRFTFDHQTISQLNEWFSRTFFSNWNEAHAYSGLYIIPPDLNEDHVWYGFAGPLLLVSALVCLWRDRRLERPVTWLALLGIGWFATYFLMNKWSLYIQRYFLPAIMLMAPCAAAVWDDRRRFAPWLHRFTFGLVAATSLWFALHYLGENRNRPFFLPSSQFTPPKILPDVPPLLRERLATQSHINVMSDAANERIYLLMTLGRNQRFTSSHTVDPAKYNLFSYWGFTRNNIYDNIAYFSSYTVVSVPTKATAGVEFLGTVGDGVNAFDYVGLIPHANETVSSPENKNVVVLVYYHRQNPDRFVDCRLRVDGLNPRDGARIEINAEMADGTTQPLMASTVSGEVTYSLRQPFKRLAIQVINVATAQKIGVGELPFTTKPTASDIPQPLSPTTLFRTELIDQSTARNLTVNGLADLEGPYDQWNLPFFRWAKQPVVRIEIPANPKLKRLRLSYNVRLQMRDEAHLSVLHNGTLVQDLWLKGRNEWHAHAVDIIPTAGENVIELADRPNDQVPDWETYLNTYPDVKAAVLAQGQDPEAGAKLHYESHGRLENRILTNKKRTKDQVPDWAAYLEQNPDVKAYVATSGQTTEAGARWHYETNGKTEGRPLPMRDNPTPDAPPPDSLYYIYRSLQLEGFSTP